MALLSVVLILTGWSVSAVGQTWTQLNYEDGEVFGVVSLGFSESVSEPSVLELDQGVPRIVLDWAKLGESISGKQIGDGQFMVEGQGGVSRIRYAKRGETGLRIVLELAPDVSLNKQEHLGSELRLYFKGSKAQASTNEAQNADLDPLSYDVPVPKLKPTLKRVTPHLLTPSAPEVVKQTQLTGEIYAPKKRLFSKQDIPYPRVAPHLSHSNGAKSIVKITTPPRKPVIVIDPGHGGSDPGAIGARGTHEKVITTTVSHRLAAVLRATNRYDVVMTRTKDVYVEHVDRLRVARERGAELFISIHADSTVNGKASGASVYTLSNRSKGRSRDITQTQNWILDVDLSEQSESVGNILVDLAQRKTLSHSSQFADRLVKELEGRVPMVRNSHRRAGYYVLLAPDVPAVLLELGFLSNVSDESRLKKRSEQDKIIRAVVRAINGHFDAKKQ
ncbi:MAG: N-acetylmuramoyl-L-alanine amidase [Maricaulaceae bacterium]